MDAARTVATGIALLLGTAAAAADAPPPADATLDGAAWIWRAPVPGHPAGHWPRSVCFFRAALAVPEQVRVASAEIHITADNLFALHLNGRLAGESAPDPNAWNQPRRFDVASFLSPGQNAVAVEAANTAAGPAGLLAKLVVRMSDGQRLVLVSDAGWRCSDAEVANWEQPGFDDQGWPAAHVVGTFGAGPWGRIAVRPQVEPPGTRDEGPEAPPPPDFRWPDGLVFVGDDCSLYRPPAGTGTALDSLSVTIFNPRDSRAFPEHDLPAPMKVGRSLYALVPARPGVAPRRLLDAGRGALGSPGVSFDGRRIYVSMALDGDPFFHIYRLPSGGGDAVRLTDGPFHDIDPAELPDGRIVFTSTRIGRFEEYHNPPARALFTMGPDGRDLLPLTHTFIFDNEPEVLADGRILMVRSDNFFDRGKVETRLHAILPDGSGGTTEFGLDLGPEYGGRLRAFSCGSPAPMPDGQVAFVTAAGIAVGRPGSPASAIRHLRIEAGDVAALPDGRLLCTIPRKVVSVSQVKARKQTVKQFSYEKIAVLDPDAGSPAAVVVFDAKGAALHSPVSLAPRATPPVLAERVDRDRDGDAPATGVLFCQDARLTKNTTAGWPHVRAIRVLAGRGLTMRSSHSYIVHAGSEVVELGTVPLAPDGSFAVEVPADTAIAFQAVDAEGRSELNEMSWIYVRPGEARGCVGCHAPRQATPPCFADPVQAMRTPPLRLLGGGDPLRFRGNNAAVTGLMELQFDRYREVAGLNRHADAADPLATGAQEVAARVAQLRDGARDRKVTAAQRLAVFRDRAAAPALADALRDGDREVRVAAALALAACGTRASVPPLLDALGDRDPLVAQAAHVALGNLTGRGFPFDAFAGRDPAARGAPAWREAFRDGAAWEAVERDLVLRLESPDRDVVRRAAVALGHVGGAAARDALRAHVARAREANPYPAWRTKHKGDNARFNALADVNPRTLQEAVRALGWLQDAAAVPLLAETLARHRNADTANLFLAEAAVEALGRIGTPEAEAALVDAFARLEDYPRYTSWYGDHGALMACHASPVHYLVAEALDAAGSAAAAPIVPHLIRAVPTDPDRALFAGVDDCEALTGRVIRRAGAEAAVVDTCLAILGDARAARVPEIERAVAATHGAWAGTPGPENRAAQILSLVCRDRAYEPRLRDAFERFRAMPVDIPRVFDAGIPVVKALPLRHWVCFYLARALGHLGDPASVDALVAALVQAPPEAASGRPDPLGPGVLFLHNDLTPCWRAASAWALGRIGDPRAAPALLAVVADLANATDTRHAAAVALGRLGGDTVREEARKLAEGYPEVSVRQALVEAGGRESSLHAERLAPFP